MQQLHLVGPTTDHTGLVLSTRRGAKTGKYTIAADEKLLAAVQEAKRRLEGGDEIDPEAEEASAAPPLPPPVPLPPPPPSKPVSSLSPREIQGRLRAGGTVKEIAAAAGVDEEWILRFADPIRAEQARVVERAQRLTFNKPRLGLSAEPLETSVLLNLAERGVRLPADVFAMAWTAFNLHGTSWAVVFSYTSRQRRQTAQWEVDLRSGELTARNRLASDLGYLEPGRRRRRIDSLEVPGEQGVPPARRRAPAKASATRTPKTAATSRAAGGKKAPAAKTVPAKKPAIATRSSVAKKVPAKKSSVVTRAAAAKRAPAAKKASAAKGGGRQSSAKARRPAKKPAAKKPAPAQAAVDLAAETSAPTPPVLPERPTHLARPPSPMNQTNRAVTLPGRLVGAPSLRPMPPPAPRARPKAPRPQASPPGPSFRPRPRPDEGEEFDNRAGPDAERPDDRSAPVDARAGARRGKGVLSASPAESEGDAGGDGSGGGGDGAASDEEKPQPRGRRRRSERRITPREGEQPSVVILSTPAVRRLEPADEPRRRVTAPPP